MPDPRALVDRLDQLLQSLDGEVVEAGESLRLVDPRNTASAVNLVHYLALRRHDLRRLQMELSELGLSSLGRCEARVQHSLEQVRARLGEMCGVARIDIANRARSGDAETAPSITPAEAEELLHENSRALFGPKPSPRHVYILVTLPAARDVTPAWVREVLEAGANCFRLNTAHDDAEGWRRAIATIRETARALDRDVRILIDLEGPKLRTLPLGPGVHVHKLRPPKNELGAVAGALAVQLSTESSPTSIPIPAEQLARLQPGDELRFRDARGKKRRVIVSRVDDGRVEALLQETTYLTDHTELSLRRGGRELARFPPGALPLVETSVGLAVDDRFWLVADPSAIDRDASRGFLEVGMSLPNLLAEVAVGHRVFVDDGKLEAVAVETAPGRVLLRVVRTPAKRFRIRGEMGINLPDTPTLDVLAAISDKDRDSLVLALEHADMIGLSFVRSAEDVRVMRKVLAEAERDDIGLVLKIETSSGFRNLSELLLEALRYHPVAVMIARGDLAVEVGFERLAELQEEILWLCEAAHVPVIWATQVLENLAKTGLPSRGEITDAAMSVRAECVMLNKGAYIARAVHTLDSILRRMETHQYKKMALYRELMFR